MRCPECSFEAPLFDFEIESKDWDVYRCGVGQCSARNLVRLGGPAPAHCGQTMTLSKRYEYDIARCPKCRHMVLIEHTIVDFEIRE